MPFASEGDKRMFKSKHRKLIEAQFNLISVEVDSFEKQALELMLKINGMIGERQYDAAEGYSASMIQLLSMYRKSIESYFTQSLRRIFDTNGEFSFSLDDVQKEKDRVFKWFEEISEQTKQLQEALESKNDKSISDSSSLVLRKIGYDHRLADFVNTLRFLQNEYVIYLIREDKDDLGSLFNRLKFHAMTRKASEKLFKDGHYAQAIFEACKVLVEQVRDKSNLTMTKDADIMGQAFSIEYLTNPLRITKRPVLCLNPLSNLTEIDEQRGFAQLFMGTWAGIRDPKAHTNVVQKDPYRTLEYLSLISLLAKRTDEAVLSNY